MNTCGHCKHYYMGRDLESRCRKTGRVVGYLQEKECFTNMNTIMEEVKTKKCKDCGRELPITAFGAHAKAKDGHQGICRECASKRMKGITRQTKKNVTEDEPEDRHADLKGFLDDELFAELRVRGFSGSLTKTLHVEL